MKVFSREFFFKSGYKNQFKIDLMQGFRVFWPNATQRLSGIQALQVLHLLFRRRSISMHDVPWVVILWNNAKNS